MDVHFESTRGLPPACQTSPLPGRGLRRLASLRRTLFLAWAGMAFCLGAAMAADSAATVAMKAEAVAPGVYLVQGESAMGSSANQNFVSNAAFVVTPGGVVVIDALGSPPLAERLIEEIRRITPVRITHVIVTHYHADHIYGLQVFRRAGAKIVAHARSRDYIGSETARLRLESSRQELFPWVDEHTEVVAPDLWVEGESMDLEVGGRRFVLRHVGPAHTPEDMVAFLADERVLFAGDLVFRGRIPFVGQADSGRWIEAIDRMLQFDAGVIVSGHGPVTRGSSADLRITRDYLAYLRVSMGEAARNLEPFEEAYARADWSRFEHLPLFKAANRINAYNTYLLMEREAK